MRYLITGISGFLGPHLAQKLIDNGHEVFGLIRGTRGAEYDLLDIMDSDTLSKITFKRSTGNIIPTYQQVTTQDP